MFIAILWLATAALVWTAWGFIMRILGLAVLVLATLPTWVINPPNANRSIITVLALFAVVSGIRLGIGRAIAARG